ncbi:hypothetical protein B0H13DRAFT_1893350 [Mycena leptocephala]|nr:hypothetical protein B0H13DRAFT_1893350 [Mycena leptocephala]
MALTQCTVPKLRTRGVDAITPIRLGSFVIMRSAIRLYLGEVLGIYRYGSVSGKHESYTDAETVDGLSYLGLRVYEQWVPTCSPSHDRLRYSISAGDSGWECWQALASNSAAYRILNIADAAEDSENEDEEDYEEPDEGSSSKKRRPKGPRGAVKKQKTGSVPTKKPRQNTSSVAKHRKKAPAGKGKPRGGRK